MKARNQMQPKVHKNLSINAHISTYIAHLKKKKPQHSDGYSNRQVNFNILITWHSFFKKRKTVCSMKMLLLSLLMMTFWTRNQEHNLDHLHNNNCVREHWISWRRIYKFRGKASLVFLFLHFVLFHRSPYSYRREPVIQFNSLCGSFYFFSFW